MVTQIDTGNTMGITREIDPLGRFVITKEVLRMQNLKSKKVAIFPLKNGIYVEFDKEKEE